MVGNDIIEEVTAFVQRYCAVENGEEPRGGYFGFFQGRTARIAKKARAPIMFGAFERCAPEVIRRIRELAENGDGHVFLRAYEHGDSSPIEVLKVTGSFDEPEEEHTGSGSAVGDLAAALVRTNSTLVKQNDDLLRLHMARNEIAVEEREQLTLMSYHAIALEHAQGQGAAMEAIAAFMPTVDKLVPALNAWMMAQANGGKDGEAPAEPTPRVSFQIARMVAIAPDIGEVIRANPAEFTGEQGKATLTPLYNLTLELAKGMGLTVAPKAGGAT